MSPVDVENSVAAGGLADAFPSVEAVLAIEELLLLDDLWTSALEDLSSEDPAEVQGQGENFGQLVERMDRALAELPQRLGPLEAILNAADDEDIARALTQIAEVGEIDRVLLEEVAFAGEIAEPGPRGAAILACQFLQQEVETERDLLARKYAILVEGRVPDPDLRPIFRCALYLAKIGAGAAAAIGTHGLTLAYHLGKAVGTGLFGWKKSECVATWHEITRGRFA
jgi:hypothetical protein